jgi:outer membrane protein assembly factor BamB
LSTTDKINFDSRKQAFRRLLFLFFLFSIVAASSPLFAQTSSMRLSWRYATGGAIRSRPVIGDDGTIFVLSEDRYLYALTPEGRRKWRCRLGERVSDCLGISRDGTLYAGFTTGKLAAVNQTGYVIWKIEFDEAPGADPYVLNDGTVIVMGERDSLYAVSHTGYIRWKRVMDASITGPPVFVDWKGSNEGDKAIIVPTEDNKLYALSRYNKILWVQATPGIPLYSIYSADTIYTVTDNEYLCAYATDGTVLWEKEIEHPQGQRGLRNLSESVAHKLVAADGRIFLPLQGGDVLIFDSEGRYRETKTVQTGEGGAIRCTADDSGTLYCVTEATEIGASTPQKSVGPRFGEPVLTPEGRLYVGGADWVLYAFQTDAEVRVEPSPEITYKQLTEEQLDTALGSNMDYQFLKNLARSLDRNGKEQFIDEVTERAESHTLGSSEPYVLGLLTLLAGEGVLTPYFSNKQSQKQIPALRIDAIRLLGKIGTKNTAVFLNTLLRYEYDEHVSAAAIRAAGALRVDPAGTLFDTIQKQIQKDSLAGRTDRLASAVIETVDSIVQYRGYAGPACHKLLFHIVKSNYSRDIREKALESMRALPK